MGHPVPQVLHRGSKETRRLGTLGSYFVLVISPQGPHLKQSQIVAFPYGLSEAAPSYDVVNPQLLPLVRSWIASHTVVVDQDVERAIPGQALHATGYIRPLVVPPGGTINCSEDLKTARSSGRRRRCPNGE